MSMIVDSLPEIRNSFAYHRVPGGRKICACQASSPGHEHGGLARCHYTTCALAVLSSCKIHRHGMPFVVTRSRAENNTTTQATPQPFPGALDGLQKVRIRMGKTTPVGFEPTREDPIGLACRCLNRSAKVSSAMPKAIVSASWHDLFQQVIDRRFLVAGARHCKTACTSRAKDLVDEAVDRKWRNRKSGHPASNQGPPDCCSTLQSDALPTEL